MLYWSAKVATVARLPWLRIMDYLAEAGSEREARAFCLKAIEGLSRLLGTDGYSLLLCGPGRTILRESTVSGYPRRMLDDYIDQYCLIDPARSAVRAGQGVAAVRWKDFAATEFVADFSEPNRVRSTAGVILFDCRGHVYANLSHQRDSGRGWTEREVALLHAVQPHLTNLLANLTLRDPVGLDLYDVTELAEGMCPLSRREAEAVRLRCRGLSAAQIASALMLSRRTVEHHLAAAYEKLGVHSRQALLGLLSSRGLLDRDAAYRATAAGPLPEPRALL